VGERGDDRPRAEDADSALAPPVRRHGASSGRAGHPSATPATPASGDAPAAPATPAQPPLPVQAAGTAPLRAAETPLASAAVPFTHDRERFEQLVNGLSARLRLSRAEGGRDMRMTLRPAELGDISVRLQLTGHGAVATLQADDKVAASLLAQAASELRQALADRGVEIDRLEITTGAGTGGQAADGSREGGASAEDARRTLYAFRGATAPAATPPPDPRVAPSVPTVDPATGGPAAVSYLA
jgi:flagellar hook-length control protein FliK